MTRRSAAQELSVDGRVTVCGHFHVKEGAIDEVLALWAEPIEHVQAHEPGTELYLLEQNDANSAELWLHEVYRDEAAFVAHGHSPVVRELSARISPHIAERHVAQWLFSKCRRLNADPSAGGILNAWEPSGQPARRRSGTEGYAACFTLLYAIISRKQRQRVS